MADVELHCRSLLRMLPVPRCSTVPTELRIASMMDWRRRANGGDTVDFLILHFHSSMRCFLTESPHQLCFGCLGEMAWTTSEPIIKKQRKVRNQLRPQKLNR